jgi:hypothetical protein
MTIMMKRATVAAMALVLASTIAVNAEPQRGGGGHGGGASHGGGGFRGGYMHSGGFGRGPAGHGFDGRRGFHAGFRAPGVFIRGGYYDPFWGGFYPYGLFPFAYYPYSAYAYDRALDSDLKVKATPKDAQVFVDGYYAGVSDHFDGAFQRLHVTAGGHVITIYKDGYRTTSRSIYARPGSTTTISDRLQPLAPGEVSAPPVAPVSPTVAPVEPQTPSDESDQ